MLQFTVIVIVFILTDHKNIFRQGYWRIFFPNTIIFTNLMWKWRKKKKERDKLKEEEALPLQY